MRRLILIFAILCASCSGYAVKSYKMDIQQGNVVTSKMMLQLRPGMNKSQVRFIMGTPLIQDTFHANRWDYFYQFRKSGRVIEQRRVILEFEQDALAHIRGDVVPAGSAAAVVDPQPISNSAKTTAKQPEKKSWLDRLKFWKDDKDAEKPQTAPADLTGSPTKPSPAAPTAPVKATAKPVETIVPESATPSAPQQPAPAEESKPSRPSKQIEVKPALAPVEPPPGPSGGPAVPVQPDQPPPLVEKPAPVVRPAPQKIEAPAAATPAVKPKPLSKPAAAKPVEKAAPAEPEKDLPPEEEPGYFERMLEKIGF